MAGQRSSGAWKWALVVGAIAVPVGLAWWITQDASDSLTDLSAAPTPLLAAAAPSPITVSVEASLTATIGAPPTLHGSGLPGTVTAVGVEPGAAVRHGDVLYSVDTVPVRAWTSPVVLYRDLSTGLAGDDVKALQRFLGAVLDREVAESGRYDSATRSAVRALELRDGSSRPGGVFHAAWTVRAPRGFIASDVPIRVGDQAPDRQKEIAMAAPSLDGVDLTGADVESALSEGGAYTFMVSGRSIEIEATADGWKVPLDDLADLLGAEALEKKGQTSIEGRLRPAEPIVGLKVPAPAVLAGVDGTSCVLVPDGSGWRAVTVEAIGVDADGSALLAAEGTPDLGQVLVNAGQLGVKVPCP